MVEYTKKDLFLDTLKILAIFLVLRMAMLDSGMGFIYIPGVDPFASKLLGAVKHFFGM